MPLPPTTVNIAFFVLSQSDTWTLCGVDHGALLLERFYHAQGVLCAVGAHEVRVKRQASGKVRTRVLSPRERTVCSVFSGIDTHRALSKKQVLDMLETTV